MNVGDIKIEFLGHSGFLFEYKGKRVAIDPYNVSSNVGKVDFVLITHSHYDHCSIKDITQLIKKEGIVIATADSQSKITKVENVEIQIVEPGDEISFGDIKISAFPAYCVNKQFHLKQEGWLGYIMKFGNVVVYHAGDTDKIPEMETLTGYGKKGVEFVALLPVSGTYVMDVDEAVSVASLLNPDLVIPMHYGSGVAGTIEDAKKFVKDCSDLGLNARILEKV